MIVVIVALENELSKRALPAGIEVVHSGVGKVNAALAAADVILRRSADLIVNYGTAGALRPDIQELIEVAHVIQRDMLPMPLAPRGATPFETDCAKISSGHPGIVCATGDSFVTAPDPWLTEQGVDIVDMELFAISHVCRRLGVPWRSFKFITDAADDQAARHWTERMDRGERLFLSQLEAMRS
jgi:adenosylhomocysteine nucleosidase